MCTCRLKIQWELLSVLVVILPLEKVIHCTLKCCRKHGCSFKRLFKGPLEPEPVCDWGRPSLFGGDGGSFGGEPARGI